MQNVTTKVRRNQGLQLRETEKTKRYGMAVRALVFKTYGIEGTKLLRDLVTTAAANGQCSPHAVGRWRTQLERVLLTAQAGTYLRALGAAELCCWQSRVCIVFVCLEVFAVRLSCEGSSDRDRDRDRDRHVCIYRVFGLVFFVLADGTCFVWTPFSVCCVLKDASSALRSGPAMN